jgi:hypothetical protein
VAIPLRTMAKAFAVILLMCASHPLAVTFMDFDGSCPHWNPPCGSVSVELDGKSFNSSIHLERARWTLPDTSLAAPIVIFHSGFTVWYMIVQWLS